MRAAAAAFVALLAAVVPSAASSAADEAQAEALYQAGVQAYADGRRDTAAIDFRAALRLAPAHRAARKGLQRLRAEQARRAEAAPAAPAAGSPRAALPPYEGVFPALTRFCYFERVLGDAAAETGRVEASLGRIAQLQAERRLCRARGRPFGRARELRALSRRLCAVSA